MGELWSHEHELLPLSAAASLAYAELTEVKGDLGSEEHLEEVIELVAIALAQLAPIREFLHPQERPARRHREPALA